MNYTTERKEILDVIYSMNVAKTEQDAWLSALAMQKIIVRHSTCNSSRLALCKQGPFKITQHWQASLAGALSRNMRCDCYFGCNYEWVIFVGLKTDVKAVTELFAISLRTIKRLVRKHSKQFKNEGYRVTNKNQVHFYSELVKCFRLALQNQRESSKEFFNALQTPSIVKSYIDALNCRTAKSSTA